LDKAESNLTETNLSKKAVEASEAEAMFQEEEAQLRVLAVD